MDYNFMFEVTGRCNLKCSYCLQKLRNNKQNIDLDFSLIIPALEDLLNKIDPSEKVTVNLFGGEPALKKKEIMVLLRELVNKTYIDRLSFIFTTNGLIYSGEVLEFLHDNNLSYYFTVSYDGLGQEKRTKDKKVIEVIENNIKKYIKLVNEKGIEINRKFAIHSCLTEDNVDKLFDNFKFMTYELGVPIFDFVFVFPEHWKNGSYSTYYKQYEKIYNYVLERNNRLVNLNIPHACMNNKYDAKKSNRLATGEYRTLIRSSSVVMFPDGRIEGPRHNRGETVKTYKTKDVKVPLGDDYKITYLNKEMNLLKKNSVNEKEFIRLTKLLLMGDVIKRYKNNIKLLFNFNYYLIKRYIKIIKKHREAIFTDVYLLFKEKGVANFLMSAMNVSETKKIFQILDNIFLNVSYRNEKILINNKEYLIKNGSLGKKLGKNENNVIIIDENNHKKISAYETIHHEIMHIYLKETGINRILLNNGFQNFEELLCEIYVDHIKNYKI